MQNKKLGYLRETEEQALKAKELNPNTEYTSMEEYNRINENNINNGSK